jgi:hypothetical protein
MNTLRPVLQVIELEGVCLSSNSNRINILADFWQVAKKQ